MKRSKRARLVRTAVRRFERFTGLTMVETRPGYFHGHEGGSTDEGWSSYAASLDTTCTPFEWETWRDGVDCDGRLETSQAGVYAPRMRCAMNRPTNQMERWGAYRRRVWQPIPERGRFVVTRRDRRDHTAEAMGY